MTISNLAPSMIYLFFDFLRETSNFFSCEIFAYQLQLFSDFFVFKLYHINTFLFSQFLTSLMSLACKSLAIPIRPFLKAPLAVAESILSFAGASSGDQ